MNCKTSPRRTRWVSRCHSSRFPVYASPEHYGLGRLWGHSEILFLIARNFHTLVLNSQFPITGSRNRLDVKEGNFKWAQTKEKDGRERPPNVSKTSQFEKGSVSCSWDGFKGLQLTANAFARISLSCLHLCSLPWAPSVKIHISLLLAASFTTELNISLNK